MLNLQVNFSCAWLLLLIVPAVLLTLLPYFKLSKKFRKTRNRISSVVLHLTALVLCIFVLSGMTFDYEVHNSENELVLVVDASYSTAEEKQAKDDFVRSVIEMTNTDVYSLGIVTFGLKPVCAVPLTATLSICIKTPCSRTSLRRTFRRRWFLQGICLPIPNPQR